MLLFLFHSFSQMDKFSARISLTSSSFGGTWLHVRCSRKAVPELELKKQRLIRQADTFHLTFTAIFLRLLMLSRRADCLVLFVRLWKQTEESCWILQNWKERPIKVQEKVFGGQPAASADARVSKSGRSTGCWRTWYLVHQHLQPRWGTSRARPLDCFRVGIAQLYRPFAQVCMPSSHQISEVNTYVRVSRSWADCVADVVWKRCRTPTARPWTGSRTTSRDSSTVTLWRRLRSSAILP